LGDRVHGKEGVGGSMKGGGRKGEGKGKG